MYSLDCIVTLGWVFLIFIAFPLPLAIVAGNESLGIDPNVLSQCGMHVSLPVQGWKNSLNVAVALAICAYQAVFAGLETSKQQGIIDA